MWNLNSGSSHYLWRFHSWNSNRYWKLWAYGDLLLFWDRSPFPFGLCSILTCRNHSNYRPQNAPKSKKKNYSGFTVKYDVLLPHKAFWGPGQHSRYARQLNSGCLGKTVWHPQIKWGPIQTKGLCITARDIEAQAKHILKVTDEIVKMCYYDLYRV